VADLIYILSPYEEKAHEEIMHELEKMKNRGIIETIECEQ
jgi:hypothetical protein